jgi:hypothetical protein
MKEYFLCKKKPIIKKEIYVNETAILGSILIEVKKR